MTHNQKIGVFLLALPFILGILVHIIVFIQEDGWDGWEDIFCILGFLTFVGYCFAAFYLLVT